MTIHEARLAGRDALVNSPTPVLDADILLSFVTGRDKTALLFKGDEPLSADEAERFAGYIRARSTGLPVAYITGVKEFYGYSFHVTPDVLIPKPDTEILVEKALSYIQEKLASRKNGILTICDMCTGSGCVGLSVLKTLTDQRLVSAEKLPSLTLVDISSAALDIARENTRLLCSAHEKDKIKFVRSNLFEAVSGSFDVILSNPPYIPAAEVQELLQDGRSEPPLALNGDVDLFGNATGDNDGLGVMRNLVPQAVSRLSPGGALIVEAGEYNAEMTEYLFRSAGLSATHIFKDLEGQLRVIAGSR